MSNSDKAIPEFASEAEERAFWETHDSTSPCQVPEHGKGPVGEVIG